MSAPNPREIQEFQFKLLSRLRIFYDDSPLPLTEALSLVAAASKYGLVFVSCPAGLRVLQIQKIVELHAHEKKKPTDTSDYPSRIISLSSQPTYLEVSCDSQYLAASHIEDNSSVIDIYDVPSFVSEVASKTLQLRPGKRVSSMSWNPGNSTMLAACLSDGSAAVYELKNNTISINSIPADAQASCLCWSPKGKQIVIGSANGSLNQFKPELKIVKSIPPPPSQNPLSVVSVQWLSSFQFAAVYKDTTDTERPVTALYIVNTPKGAPVTYINYEDVCFSTSNCRPPQYYISHQQNWNVLLVASGTSIELGVLGLQNDTWEQWIQEDQYRAELPLRAEEKDETFPVGMAFDTSVQYNLPYGENQCLPPMPLLLLLSDEGLLSLFFVVNTLPSAVNICFPPESLPDQSGLHHFNFPTKDAIQPYDHEVVITTETTSLISPMVPNQPQLQTQTISQTQPSWLGISQSQASSVPNWVSAANPAITLAPAYSHPSNTQSFLTPTSVPASTSGPLSMFGMDPKSSQPFVLPGTQVTVTPVATSVGVINLPSGLTSLPLAPMYSISSSSPQSHVLSKSTANITPLEVKKPEPAAPQSSDISPVKPDDVDEETKNAVSAKNDAVIIAAIHEEMAIFSAELEELLVQHRNMNITIGTQSEKEDMARQIHSLEVCFKELKETTEVQKAKVHSLKNLLLQTFNFVEDAKSRQEQLKNPAFMKLVKSQDLDPLTARKMANIEHLLYYVDSQLIQANKYVDNFWIDCQKKKLKTAIKVPTLEIVYQALVMLNNVLHQQTAIVEDIEQRLETRHRKKTSRFPFISEVSSLNCTKDSEHNELSKLADNFLKIKLGKSSTDNLNETNNHYSISDVERRKEGERKLLELQQVLIEHSIISIKPSEHIVDQSRKMSDSSSLLSIISSLPGSGAKPGGISSGQPIVTSSAPKENTTVAQGQNSTHEKLGPFVPQKEIQAGTQVLVEVRNNLITSFHVETPVKPIPVTGQKLLQTSLFGNKENKPSTASVIPSSLIITQPETSINQSQPQLFPSFSSNDKKSNKEFALGEVPKMDNSSQLEILKPSNSTTSLSSFTYKTSSGNQVISSTTDSSVQPKSPLSSLSNMVSGFGDMLPRLSPEKSTTSTFSKTNTNQNTNQAFPFSFTDPNKPIQNSVSATQPNTTTPNDSFVSKNLFGGSTTSQKTSIALEPATSKSIFSGGSTPTKSMFSGDTTTKNIIDGECATKNIFGIDSSSSKNIFGMDSTQSKNVFGSDTLTVSKSSFESDSTKSKGLFGSEVGTTTSNFGSDSVIPGVFDKNLSSSQNIFGSNSSATKLPSIVESNVTKPDSATGFNSANSKSSDILKVATTTSSVSPVHPNLGSPKTVFSSGMSSTAKSIFSAEPTIITDEPTTETKSANSTVTVTKEDSSQVESSSALFGSLTLGSALSTTQTKSAASAFGGSSTTFGSSNIENFSSETTSASKQVEEPSNTAVFGAPAATTLASSFNFGVAGASLFGNQSKSESTPTATSSPAKTGITSLSFGQMTISATESSPATSSVPATTKAAFSFSLPQNTSAATTSAFSFAQTATSLTSTSSDDKNTKISLAFGQPSMTTANSVFGGFNTQPATTSTSSSIFGTPPATTASQTSFTFALPATTAAQTSFFGNSSSVFGSAPVTTTNSFFGSPATTSSVFGQPSVTPPAFGQAASSTSSPFGSSSGFGSKPTFGQSGGSLFGQSPSGGFGSAGGTSMFGGGTSVFGPAASGPGVNLFQTTGTGSIFGGGSTSPSGSFSSGGQSVSQTGFGSPPAFQNKIGAFGSAPAFGAANPPAFGGAPTFGGAPAFASPSKVFGSPPPTGGFGSPTQQPTAFESLADQNTMTFGNLAQTQSGGFGSSPVFGATPPPQQQQQQQPGFSNAGASFSGTSFSSWR